MLGKRNKAFSPSFLPLNNPPTVVCVCVCVCIIFRGRWGKSEVFEREKLCPLINNCSISLYPLSPFCPPSSLPSLPSTLSWQVVDYRIRVQVPNSVKLPLVRLYVKNEAEEMVCLNDALLSLPHLFE